MTEDSWPASTHTAVDDTEAEFERLMAYIEPSAVIGTPADTAVVFGDSSPGRIVKVRLGKYAKVRGYLWASGLADVSLSIAANSSGSTRQDIVVLRLDRATQEVRAAVKTGTTTLTQNDPGVGSDFWEILLAQVAVPNGASVITAANVTRKENYVRPSSLIVTSDTLPAALKSLSVYEWDTGKSKIGTGSAFVTSVEDSGEVPCTVSAGWTSPSGAVVRKYNGLVLCQLQFTRTGGNFVSAITVASVPEHYRPGGTVRFTGIQQQGGHLYECKGAVAANGAITLDTFGSVVEGGNVASGATFYFGQFPYIAEN